MRSSLRLLQLGKACTQQQRPNAAKKKKNPSSFEELTHTTAAVGHYLVGHTEITLLPEEFSQNLYVPISTYVSLARI